MENRQRKIIYVNLTKTKTEIRKLSEEVFKKYLGGSGISSWFLYKNENKNLHPLHPDNPILFFAGLLTGNPIPAASKVSVCARSPLTGIWSEATVGGYWGLELKKQGYEGIFITGKAERPVYLRVSSEGIKIENSQELWGLDTYKTAEIIKQKYGENNRIASIGQAGEKLVNISSIVFDAPHSRLAGRGGLGAVMGAKNLKAVIIEKGFLRSSIDNLANLKKSVKLAISDIKKYTEGLNKLGTGGAVAAREYIGDLPIKNFSQGRWEGAKKITGQVIKDTIFSKNYACYYCPIACGKQVKIKKEPFIVHGPEYETLSALGSLILNEDLDSIVTANDLCNRYGIDTISLGVSIAFLIEAAEKGFLKIKGINNHQLKWGSPKLLIDIIHQVAENKGLGRLAGMGVRKISRRIGKDTERFAIHVKGLELPMHDPRAYTGMALSYATANRGGCHLESLSYAVESGIPLEDLGYGEDNILNPHTSVGKAELVIKLQNYMNVLNALGLCKFLLFGRVGPTKVTEWLNHVTGWNLTPDELLIIGERLHNLKRMYNIRLGINRKDDTIPSRLLETARNGGFAAGVLPELDKMLKEYYQLRNWDDNGIPTDKKIKELGL